MNCRQVHTDTNDLILEYWKNVKHWSQDEMKRAKDGLTRSNTKI